MRMAETVLYEGEKFLTTRQLSEMFEVEQKIIGRNFQRNSHRYEEGEHYRLLTGDELKRFKKTSEQSETLKFVSILYLWTKEGAMLLAKSCSSDSTWEIFDSLLDEVYSKRETDVERLENMSPIGVDMDGNVLISGEDWKRLSAQSGRVQELEEELYLMKYGSVNMERCTDQIKEENKRLREAINKSLEKHKWNNEESAKILEKALEETK